MLGAIIGDTVGSIYEFDNIKTTDFEFFSKGMEFTDDSILSVAVADWLLNDKARSMKGLEDALVRYVEAYPNPVGGYGSGFLKWARHPESLIDWRTKQRTDGKRVPYYSCGNGSAMRASACGWVAKSLDEAMLLGELSAKVTHDHPEGIKGAQAVSTSIYMALHGSSKKEIKSYVEKVFGYNLSQSCDDIRPDYGWGATCQDTVPQAIVAFLDSVDFESAIRLAISLGGDSDTLACITGGIAQAYYKEIPTAIIEKMKAILPESWWTIIDKIDK